MGEVVSAPGDQESYNIINHGVRGYDHGYFSLYYVPCPFKQL